MISICKKMDIAENYAVAPIFFIESDWEHCLRYYG